MILEEDLLIARARGGDAAAFEALVRAHDRAVLRLALSMLGSEEEARDVYQDTFLRIHRRLGGFRGDCPFRSWALRIAANLCRDRLRRRVRAPAPPAPIGGDADDVAAGRAVDGDPGADPARLLQAREIGRRIDSALAGLAPRERLAFTLKHDEELTMTEIAKCLESTEETARNCLYRAHQKLRGALGDLRAIGTAPARTER